MALPLLPVFMQAPVASPRCWAPGSPPCLCPPSTRLPSRTSTLAPATQASGGALAGALLPKGQNARPVGRLADPHSSQPVPGGPQGPLARAAVGVLPSGGPWGAVRQLDCNTCRLAAAGRAGRPTTLPRSRSDT